MQRVDDRPPPHTPTPSPPRPPPLSLGVRTWPGSCCRVLSGVMHIRVCSVESARHEALSAATHCGPFAPCGSPEPLNICQTQPPALAIALWQTDGKEKHCLKQHNPSGTVDA
eukprot:SAG22_NODE_6749_length_816_cov_1.309623_2_plen_111_part_01